MQFRVCDRNEQISIEKNTVYLRRDNWDDYSYKTMFGVRYVDNIRHEHILGTVKIGIENMEKGRIFDHIPKQFETLPELYFSLGQDERYYENLAKLGDHIRIEILTALQDVAYNLCHFSKYQEEDVMIISLMRDISTFSVKLQLNRMAHGGARLTKYSFTYSATNVSESESDKNQMAFVVEPDSNPPTNVHVLIGRNGTGKTSLIKNMIYSIRNEDTSHGTFHYTGRVRTRAEFANILCVAFSPFDDFSGLDEGQSEIPYTYIGLDKKSNDLLKTIEEQFVSALSGCISNARKRKLWADSIDVLKSDPTFAEGKMDLLKMNLTEYARNGLVSDNLGEVRQIFSQLSSGHKVVLLIITSCVDRIEEKSIVFMDEPENHLHPPLLAALIRALSNLLIDRNGVAIISTHSPVVLQEVPNSCVWTLRRCGSRVIPERIPVQTFGSSIGQLTNEVFGPEVTDSGFHKMLSDAVDKGNDYEEILNEFDGQLGDEAKLHLRTLLAVRKAQEE